MSIDGAGAPGAGGYSQRRLVVALGGLVAVGVPTWWLSGTGVS